MSNLELRPIDLEFLASASSQDARLVPATGALITLSRQGATVTTAASCPSGSDTQVAVSNTGRLKSGDSVAPRGDPAKALAISAINLSGIAITLKGFSVPSTTVGLQPGDRLVVIATAIVTQSILLHSHAETEVSVTFTSDAQAGTIALPNGDPSHAFSVTNVDPEAPTILTGAQ